MCPLAAPLRPGQPSGLPLPPGTTPGPPRPASLVSMSGRRRIWGSHEDPAGMGDWTSAPLTACPFWRDHTPGTPGTRVSSPKLPAGGRAGDGSGRARLGFTLCPKLPQFPRDSPAGAPVPPRRRGSGAAVRALPAPAPAPAPAGAASRLRGALARLRHGAGLDGVRPLPLPSPSRLGDTSPTPPPP